MIAGLVAVLLAVIWFAVYQYKKAKYKRSADYQITTALAPCIRDEVKNVIVPDGVGGLLEINHLILLNQGLLVVDTHPASGYLFGADELDEWTQLADGKQSKFANPLRHIWASQQAVKALAPHIPVFCRVIFIEDATFPKGKPDDVSILPSLADDLAVIKLAPVIIEEAQKSWDMMMRIARKNGQAVKRNR